MCNSKGKHMNRYIIGLLFSSIHVDLGNKNKPSSLVGLRLSKIDGYKSSSLDVCLKENLENPKDNF